MSRATFFSLSSHLASKGVNRHGSVVSLRLLKRVPDVDALSYIPKRGFLSAFLLKLSGFNRRCRESQERFGQLSDDYKKRFAEQLRDSYKSLASDDYTAYIFLARPHEVSLVEEVALKFAEMAEEQEDLTSTTVSEILSRPVSNLDLMILRKYHVLRMPQEALQFYKRLKSPNMYRFYVMLDLLMENEMYSEAVEICKEAMLTNDTLYFEAYFSAIIAAYKMASLDGLKAAGFIFDQWKNFNLKNKDNNKVEASTQQRNDLKTEDMLRLISIYCIQQDQLAAASVILKAIKKRTPITANIEILLRMKRGETNPVLNNLKRLLDDTRNANIPFIKADLFTQLEDFMMSHEEAVKSSQLKVFETIRNNKARYVSQNTIEEAIMDQLHRFGNQKMRHPDRRSGSKTRASSSSTEGHNHKDDVEELIDDMTEKMKGLQENSEVTHPRTETKQETAV